MSATLLSDKYSHLPSIRTPSFAFLAISGVVLPLLRSLPVLARMSERFLIVRSSSARLSLATLNSGIGTDQVSATGLDVIGTINGESATGKGQILTGNSGNSTTDGLTLRITSALAGSHGTIRSPCAPSSRSRITVGRNMLAI